ncbi:DUF2778 domain-containing protein [Methylobacterium sp. J-026]|uniref:tlde1 domain-containing protein n=1 Tax=Methylobacterium sp. J-026 TaxID=2836624 RepID=UPI001FB98E8F|nr:tlde1 domain-containing protein [Methylobacterium sp. J-026]MCJ2137057.1 DUF2778 domain-containing protein [Methylobacterium sp. J-026]
MAIDSTPLDHIEIGRARRSCLAPLAVLTGAAAMTLLGSGVLTRDPQLSAPTGYSAARSAAMTPTIEGRTVGPNAEPSGAEPAPADALAGEPAPGGSWGDIPGGGPSRWAWTRIAPLDSAPNPETAPTVGTGEPPRVAVTVPLPIPRPPELRGLGASALTRRAERRVARRDLPPVQSAAPPADDRSFLEKFFGIERAPALAYAALESKPADVAPQRRISPPLAMTREPSATTGVAVYNIATRTVTLPNGERLEAHSGLGEGLDDPRLVNVRMRGPTPPGTYELTEREQLFHGVRAIRLTPVGGSDAVYGRVGLLAHTFMLGPRGDSNGCVSFRDYDRFLQAFLRGEVQRLVVVSGTQDSLPTMADGGRTRLARAGN